MDRFAELAGAWWAWMVPMLWQASGLALVVAIDDRALARWAWPELRAALWLLVIVKLLIPPSLAAPLGVSAMDALSQLDVARDAAAAVTPSSEIGGNGVLVPAAFLAWLVVAATLAIALVARHRRVRRRVEAGTGGDVPSWLHDALGECALRIGLARTPRLVVSAAVGSPVLIGMLRPLIALPPWVLARLDRHEVEHVLLHELAHLARRDPWLQLFAVAVQVVYWFHPAAWIARRGLALAREIACDLAVADLLAGEAMLYRRTLLRSAREVLRLGGARAEGAVGLAFLTTSGVLALRLRWLERHTAKRRRLRRSVTAALSLGVALFVLPMADANAGGHSALSGARSIGPVDPALLRAACENVAAAARGERRGCLIYHFSGRILEHAAP